jgi:UDP-N-acetylglucosamine 2-epimerase (non-hydrolysing)
MKILNIVGARPNFMKMAPIIEAMNKYPDQIEHLLVHTGQHYDEKMSKAFFVDLGMPKPDIDLEVGSGSHAEQTAKIMVAFEKVCLEQKPDLVIVVGDVNSTMACTITAKKLGIQVAHVEAGLRSRDMTMPEEINRLCTDVLCDYLFTTDRFADANLKAEGIPAEKIFFVGNVMIDTLLKHKAMAERLPLMRDWGLAPKGFVTLTLHRPSNVDNPATLRGIMEVILEIAQDLPVIFPIHPRTRKILDDLISHSEIKIQNSQLRIVDPLGYLEFLHLNMHAKLVLTDSGGLQEETTVLGIPCITLRHNTERPITCTEGTNILIGNDPQKIRETVRSVLRGEIKGGSVPEKWDGKAAERIVLALIKNKSEVLI